ncbi:hypothetical protein KQI41_01130 [Tissierella pigra]|uniref:hypothetical protein n=1 Tax=Tissierella pigra TaxID=2607614 RepID=UPI001C10907A|nr:hypothetical protein [Tissierella pigra]MBU5424998.1 hypothetical protein [Tissierella pigra]
MTIGEILKHKDIYTYNKLMNMFKIKEPKKKIELGCSVEELMRSDSYKRVGGKIKQRSWG